MSLDLETHLTFYGAYHHNSVNVAIHIVFVPIILVTGFGLATNTGALITLPDALTTSSFELNLGVIVAILYACFYMLLEPVAGAVLGIMCVGATTVVSSVRAADETGFVNQVMIGAHVVSWLAQFLGHGAFEGRAPALLDNIVQALVLAPLFVWLEILFRFGYRPELRARVEKKVVVELEKFRASKAKKAQ